MGQKSIDFDDRTIKIDGLEFRETPGLFQLILSHKSSFNEADRKDYGYLLEPTNFYRNPNGVLKSPGNIKYHGVLRPLFILSKHRYSAALSSHTQLRRSYLWADTGLVYKNTPLKNVY